MIPPFNPQKKSLAFRKDVLLEPLLPAKDPTSTLRGVEANHQLSSSINFVQF